MSIWRSRCLRPLRELRMSGNVQNRMEVGGAGNLRYRCFQSLIAPSTVEYCSIVVEYTE